MASGYSILRFTLRTLLLAMVVVAAYFAGRAAVMEEVYEVKRRNLQLRANLEGSFTLTVERQFAAERLLERYSDFAREHSPYGVDSAKEPVTTRELVPLDASVLDIIDGDSVRVYISHNEQRVRLHGIDCPEIDQPFGEVAMKFTSSFLRSRKIQVIPKRHDGVAYLFAEVISSGSNLSRQLLAAGLAWHDIHSSHDEELAKLEAEARDAKRGIWSDKNPIPPWEWRQELRTTTNDNDAAARDSSFRGDSTSDN